MLTINIKPKLVPQGFMKEDLYAEILQIHSVIPEEIDTKARVQVALCTAQKDSKGNISGVGGEIYSVQIEYVNPEYSNWIKDEDLVQFVCSKLEVEPI